MSGTKQKGEPHYSQGPTPSKPCPNATMDFAPPREDLTSGSVNLITNEAGKRPAILLNIQRGPNAPQRPRLTAPSTTTPVAAAPPPPLAPPPSQYTTHNQQPSSSGYPPASSYPPAGSYPPSTAYQAHPGWGAPPSWGAPGPSWGGHAPQSWSAPPAWGAYPSNGSSQAWGAPPPQSWGPPPPGGPPPWGAPSSSTTTPSWGAPPTTGTVPTWGSYPPTSSSTPAPPTQPPGPWDFYYGQMQGGVGAAPPLRRTPPPAPPLPEAPTAKIADPVAPPGEEDKAAAPPLIAATAVKKGAVIYSTPRPPTPEKPKPVEAMAPHGPVVVPVPENHNLNEIFNPTTTITEPPPPQPVTYMDALVSLEKSMNPAGFPESANVEKPKRKQYFHDGEAWVYAFEQPPMKKKAEPVVLEDVVKKAILTNVLENMEKGKYNVTPQFKDNGRRKKNKPEAIPIKCEVCKLTVSCQKTFESHLAGRPHQKKMAQAGRAKKLEEKIKQDTELAKNALPGGEGPNNPLESTEDGNIRCKVCDCIMNSGAQAQAHLTGTKHRHRMDKVEQEMMDKVGVGRSLLDKHMRGLRGRGRGRGSRGSASFRGGHNFRGGFNQGSGTGWGSSFGEPDEADAKDEDEVTTAEAEEEYKRVFAECLENNFDLDLATKTAKAAMRAALNIVDSEDEESEGDDDEDAEMEDLTRGITVIEPPSDDGGKPGQYRCDLCDPPVQLHTEVELENHVVSEEHKKAGALLAPLTSFPHGGAGEKGKGRGRGKGKLDPTRGKVYKGRPNALSSDTMKAQRGRRGLISFGEVMPSKLTKAQKKLAKVKNDISTILAKHKVEAALTAPTEEKPKMPMLQAFVKGNEEGELHGGGEVNYAAYGYQNDDLDS